MKNIKIIIFSLLLVTMLFAACSDQKKEPAKEQAKSDVKYTCPMHPQIMEDHPGSCPICGMTLYCFTAGKFFRDFNRSCYNA